MLLPNTSSIITSPIETGKSITVLFTIFIHSNILSFGIVLSVLTATGNPSEHLTVVVTVLTGFVHSLSAYFAPLGHVFPLTLKTFFPDTVYNANSFFIGGFSGIA